MHVRRAGMSRGDGEYRGCDRSAAEVVPFAGSSKPRARATTRRCECWLRRAGGSGLGLASLSPIFSPDRIVVGGGIAAAGELLLAPAQESYRTHARPEFASTEVIGSSFNGWDGIVGAASVFLDPVP